MTTTSTFNLSPSLGVRMCFSSSWDRYSISPFSPSTHKYLFLYSSDDKWRTLQPQSFMRFKDFLVKWSNLKLTTFLNFYTSLIKFFLKSLGYLVKVPITLGYLSSSTSIIGNAFNNRNTLFEVLWISERIKLYISLN